MYRMMYDRFVNVHHLDNLVWVWNVNAPSGNAGSIADYYPGAEFADIVTMDWATYLAGFHARTATSAVDSPAGDSSSSSTAGRATSSRRSNRSSSGPETRRRYLTRIPSPHRQAPG